MYMYTKIAACTLHYIPSIAEPVAIWLQRIMLKLPTVYTHVVWVWNITALALQKIIQ